DEEPSDEVVDRHEDAEEDVSHASPACGCFESSHGEEGEQEGASDSGVSGGKEPVLAGSGRAGAIAEDPSFMAGSGRAGEIAGGCNTGSDAAAASDCADGFGGNGIFWPSRTRPTWQSRQIRGRCLKIFPPPKQL